MFDLRTPAGRQLVWALIVVLKPMWIHCGFPCTFWSTLAHCTRTRDEVINERTRLEELVYIFFSKQVAVWQKNVGRHVSIENPPRCMSWKLDVVLGIISSCQLRCVNLDLCMWGARDPGNGLSYKKSMRLASDIDLTALIRKCNGQHVHQIVEGSVCSGPEKGRRRSKISGEYPMELCRAWVKAMHSSIGSF